jgi:hypothetical protein
MLVQLLAVTDLVGVALFCLKQYRDGSGFVGPGTSQFLLGFDPVDSCSNSAGFSQHKELENN